MSEQFNNKDYGDYFSAVERSIERKRDVKDTNTKPTVKQTKKRKRFLGGIYRIRPIVPITALALVIIIVILILCIPSKNAALPQDTNPDRTVNEQALDVKESTETPKVNLVAEFTDNTADIPADFTSGNIIVVNCETNEVVAGRDATAKCYPASTTKIMTVLTAADYITNFDKTFTFSYEVTDPFYLQQATMAGFAADEAVTMTDLFYGAILPSGADGCAGLAITIAGSEQEFAKLMNKKAKELGLKNSNFTNATGLFDKNHYTTPEDMAVVVRAAMQNEFLRKVLSTYQYTTASTPQHPDGILLTSTLFSCMYGTEPEGSDIIGGKTGFVSESGYCIASFGHSDGGTEYVCVTLNGLSQWPTVYDQIDLYTEYAK